MVRFIYVGTESFGGNEDGSHSACQLAFYLNRYEAIRLFWWGFPD